MCLTIGNYKSFTRKFVVSRIFAGFAIYSHKSSVLPLFMAVRISILIQILPTPIDNFLQLNATDASELTLGN
jgi:hypothetical protein